MGEEMLTREVMEELEVEEEAWEAMEDVWERVGRGTHTGAVGGWGNNCHLPGRWAGPPGTSWPACRAPSTPS